MVLLLNNIVAVVVSRQIWRQLPRTPRTASPRHALHSRLEGLVLHPGVLLGGVILLDELQTRFQILFQLLRPVFPAALSRCFLGWPHVSKSGDLVAVLLQHQVPFGLPSLARIWTKTPVGSAFDCRLAQIVGDPFADFWTSPDFSGRLGNVAKTRHGLDRNLFWLEGLGAVLAQMAEGGSHFVFYC